MNYARVLMKTSQCSVSKDRVVKLKGDWILVCPHLVKQFMKDVVGNVSPMLKHNMIGLMTHQSCNQDVN
jgi:hypothetical protein